MDRRVSGEEKKRELCDIHWVAGIVRVVEYELPVVWGWYYIVMFV